MSRQGFWRLYGLPAATAVLAFWVVACPREEKPPAVAAGSSRPECPMTDVSFTVKGERAEMTVTRLAVAAEITNVPEFHDCQRLLDREGQRYGPLVGIWASADLDSMIYDLDKFVGDSGRIMAMPVAELYSWDGAYDPLGIQREFNCLYMWRVDKVWRARMVPVGPQEGRCGMWLDPAAPPPNSKDLDVGSIPPPPQIQNAVPPVARWDWSAATRVSYIGIMCGGEWCEVGKGFVSSPGHTAAQVPMPDGEADPIGKQKVVEVKGWYDEQYLAPPVGPHGFGTAVSRLGGTAFPHSALDSYTSTTFQVGSWKPTAYVRLEKYSGAPTVPDYNAKYGFLWGVNTVYLCTGPVEKCIPDPAQRPKPCKYPTGDASMDPALWWAKIVPRAAPTKAVYKCVVRRTHPEITKRIPGVVRWRWQGQDETMWIACAQGCCEVWME